MKLSTMLVLLSLFALPAFAQQDPPSPPAREVIFDETDLVEGDFARPDHDVVVVPLQGRPGSLIKVRETFEPELLRSAEDI